jgi:hypothetical protein
MRLVITVGVVGFLTILAAGLLAGEKSPAEKAAADWLYPGAKVMSSGISSGKGGAVSCVVQETADDVPKILKYYGDKLGTELKQVGTQSGGAFNGRISVEYAHVGLKQGAAGGAMTVSTFKTKTAVSTVVVSRSQGGKASTVTITHVPQEAAE